MFPKGLHKTSLEFVIKDVLPDKRSGINKKVAKSKLKPSIPSRAAPRQQNPVADSENVPPPRPKSAGASKPLISKHNKKSVHVGLPVRPHSATASRRPNPASRVPQYDVWDRSPGKPDREMLNIQKDHEISEWRFSRPSFYDTYPAPPSSPTLVLKDEKSRHIKKEKSESGRDRMPCKTFTAIINNPFPQYPHLHDVEPVKRLNREKWSHQSNTYELHEPKRFLPEHRGKSQEEFRKDFRIGPGDGRPSTRSNYVEVYHAEVINRVPSKNFRWATFS